VLEDGGYSEHLAGPVGDLDIGRLPADVARSVGAGTIRALVALRGIGADLARRGGVADTAVLLAMGRDRADGRIGLRGGSGRLTVSWDTPSNDPLYTAERIICADVVRAFGPSGGDRRDRPRGRDDDAARTRRSGVPAPSRGRGRRPSANDGLRAAVRRRR
jgi:hypothetical protein